MTLAEIPITVPPLLPRALVLVACVVFAVAIGLAIVKGCYRGEDE